MTDQTFGPIPAEVLTHNRWVAEWHADKPNAWEFPAHVVRASRDEGKSIFGLPEVSDRAELRTVHVDGRSVAVRILRPDAQPTGVYLHIHGGGWTIGAAHHQDALNEALINATGFAVVSVEYRLAPEDPYPAGPDDCETAALWLTEHAQAEFGTTLVTIGGESAGAHLSLVTMLRMRDRHSVNFRAANLVYGAYDLAGTPSSRRYGDRKQILGTSVTNWFVNHFTQGAALDDPDISPIHADVAGLPNALFTVGTNDPLLDDSLFMYMRYRAAGNEAQLALWPGAIHAFDYFYPTGPQAAEARALMHEFLAGEVR